MSTTRMVSGFRRTAVCFRAAEAEASERSLGTIHSVARSDRQSRSIRSCQSCWLEIHCTIAASVKNGSAWWPLKIWFCVSP
ncbi:MAG: hypothetical protein VXB67_18565, partial [Deltaproteobacteria bacterium]